MIASVIAVAVFTAGVTSALTQREMQGIVHDANDLRHVRVGAVANSPTVTYLDRERISHRTFPTAVDALKALEANELDAFVHDKPLLTWLVLQDFFCEAARAGDRPAATSITPSPCPSSARRCTRCSMPRCWKRPRPTGGTRRCFQYLGKSSRIRTARARTQIIELSVPHSSTRVLYGDGQSPPAAAQARTSAPNSAWLPGAACGRRRAPTPSRPERPRPYAGRGPPYRGRRCARDP